MASDESTFDYNKGVTTNKFVVSMIQIAILIPISDFFTQYLLLRHDKFGIKTLILFTY